jgi:hypothetical protein
VWDTCLRRKWWQRNKQAWLPAGEGRVDPRAASLAADNPAHRGSRGLYAAAAVACSGGSRPICCSEIFLIVDPVDVRFREKRDVQ